MGTAGFLNDNASITAPVKSFWPNDYGLFCMAGNVNEWVQDVYRPLSFEDVDAFNPFRGNVFKALERDEDGIVAEKDSLGRLRYRDVTDEESANRYNYQKADYINHLDGDFESSIPETVGEGWLGSDGKTGSGRMYKQDIENDYTSLINDKARVFKGGSWRDRAYWLGPATRRFLDQESSRADLGFRCAMIRVGSPGGF
jgi:gliding motility-associated lipoprotein GldJ